MATKATEIGIQNPCHLDWTKMSPREGGRFCGDCKKVVRDLSSMSESEARALVAKPRHDGLCVRMLVDRDGNVFFGKGDLISASLLGKAKRAAMAAAAIALPLASSACTAITEPLGLSEQEETTDPHELQPLMGGVAAPDDKAIAEDVDAGADAQKHDGGDTDSDADLPSTDGGADAAPDVNVYK